jgi:hypothetical protein
MREPTLALWLLLVTTTARAQDVAPMPETRGLDPTSASACARGESDPCITAGDAAVRAGDGAHANALYRRGADLARRAMHIPARPAPGGAIRTAAAAIAALEASWPMVVTRGAGVHGQRAVAEAARTRVFGDTAVARWSGRRASTADAFAAVHTWTHREGGAFASGVWVGDLRLLAASVPCWQLTFAYQELAFIAFVDDHGRVVAIVHTPEG